MKCIDPMLTTAFAGNIGVAREDITPPIGIYARNWFFSHSTMAHSPVI
jgi:hypothetical protein